MAAFDEVAPSRETFLEGDVGYKRAVSEAMLRKHAAQNNFVNERQTDIKTFHLNGSYSVATGIVFFDGVATFLYDSEIVGVDFWNGQAGTSGLTDYDIEWLNTGGGAGGSIFSQTPQIIPSAGNTARGFVNLQSGQTIGGTGITLPTFSKTQFLAGEAIYFRINSAMVSAMNCGLSVFYRPI